MSVNIRVFFLFTRRTDGRDLHGHIASVPDADRCSLPHDQRYFPTPCFAVTLFVAVILITVHRYPTGFPHTAVGIYVSRAMRLNISGLEDQTMEHVSQR